MSVKYDRDKPRASLVLGGFPDALLKVAEVGTFGADKYSDNGWKAVPKAAERYKDALYRHLLQSEKNWIDKESGLPHMAHAAWNALAVLQFILDGDKPIDDLEGVSIKYNRVYRGGIIADADEYDRFAVRGED